jgi:succinate dehydrogenase / fumarate reductase cytochrome b subunit
MRWSGVILALFIVYHLLHMTAGVVSFQPGEFMHGSVYHNVVAAFSVWYVFAGFISVPITVLAGWVR